MIITQYGEMTVTYDATYLNGDANYVENKFKETIKNLGLSDIEVRCKETNDEKMYVSFSLNHNVDVWEKDIDGLEETELIVDDYINEEEFEAEIDKILEGTDFNGELTFNEKELNSLDDESGLKYAYKEMLVKLYEDNLER